MKKKIFTRSVGVMFRKVIKIKLTHYLTVGLI